MNHEPDSKSILYMLLFSHASIAYRLVAINAAWLFAS